MKRLPSPNDYCRCLSQKKFKNCCMFKFYLDNDGSKGMRFLKLAGIEVYRPRKTSEQINKVQAEAFLREKFDPGVYTKQKDVQAIIKRQVDFFGNKLDELMPKIACRNFIDFLLWQYDRTGEVETLDREGKLKHSSLYKWHEIGPTYRRALKYLVERTTMLAPKETPLVEDSDLLDLTDQVCICAEQLINYCILSDQARIFHDSTEMTIQAPDQPTYVDHKQKDLRIIELHERERRYAEMRGSTFQSSYETNAKRHGELLDEALIETVGATYGEMLSILIALDEYSLPHPNNPWPIKFMNYKDAVNRLSEGFKKEPPVIEKILSGFMLKKEDLLSRVPDGEDYWNPKAQYRAYRRGLFLLPHETGDHLCWSKHLFREGLIVMQREVPYGQFPDEWRSESVNSSLGEVVRERGNWFEEQVRLSLKNIGIEGKASRTWIGSGKYAIKIPNAEFDFIGWSQEDQALVLLECKMLQYGSEPKMWANQIQAFTKGKEREEAYIPKLARKAKWCLDNSSAIVDALRSEGIAIDSVPRELLTGFVSYSPLAASYFVEQFPCVALPELITSYREGNRWPYERGVDKIV